MKKSKIFILVLVIVLTATSLFACKPRVRQELEKDISVNGENLIYPMDITDVLGNTVTIEKEPERIISIDPSHTEILFELGLSGKIVGVSNFCDYPVEALEKDKVGDAFAINVEKILDLDPDLVFIYGAGQQEAVDQLKANGITIVSNESETIDEIFNAILKTGKIMNIEGKAEGLVKEMREKRDNIVNKVKDREKVRVFYQVWDEPLMTASTGSYIDELINLAGGENVASDAKGSYSDYSVESMIEKDPQVYIAPAHSEEGFNLDGGELEDLKNNIKSRPGYDVISAVKNDRIELLEPNIVSRAGVRIMEALDLFARAIHPEVF